MNVANHQEDFKTWPTWIHSKKAGMFQYMKINKFKCHSNTVKNKSHMVIISINAQ